MKIKALKPGMKVYTVTKTRMGNTTIKTVNVHEATIISVDENFLSFTYTWNGNPERKAGEHTAKQFKAKKPVVIRNAFGQARLATKEEIKLLADKDSVTEGEE